MKTLLSLTFLISGILCLQVFAPSAFNETALADSTLINPNGSSELSLLMREMQQYSNTAKASIKSGQSPASYPKTFDKIYTSKISEGMSKSDYYKSFADLYIMSVKNYASSSSSERVETFNNMVSACLACHSQHCPGPVPVIKKLMIAQ